MVSRKLTDDQIKLAQSAANEIRDLAHMHNLKEVIPLNSNEYHFLSLCTKIAWCSVIDKPIPKLVSHSVDREERRKDSLVYGCRFRTTNKDYGDVLVRKEHEDDAFVITAVISNGMITFTNYIQAKDAKKPENWADHIPHPAYISKSGKPVEELIEKLKGESHEVK